MATITLHYDARNNVAKRTIDYILSLGFFKTTEKTEAVVTHTSGLDEAINDVKQKRTCKAKNSKDLIKQCLK
ncbi:MAG: hypothetical protein LBQ31_05685 [Bacteroidales bacterium]|jgi:hypothetical protein|nr:hypothetical protein [Bacteroidales bacterium]